MNIKAEIQEFLRRTGMKPTQLAAAAGVPAPSITRLLSGERGGLNSKTIEKLWPFLYPHPQPGPGPDHGEAA